MKNNIAQLERILRVLFGFIIIFVAWCGLDLSKIALGVIGLLFVLSGLVGWSAIYTLNLSKTRAKPAAKKTAAKAKKRK